MTDLRLLPSVDQLLQTEAVQGCVETYGRPLTLQAVREVLAAVRARHPGVEAVPDRSVLLDQIQSRLGAWTSSTLQGVINATGVILHTNLGRAPLSQAALDAVREISPGYSTLEYELGSGKRGSRAVHAEEFLKRLTNAESALVVNNNAAAVLLVLSAIARRRAVVIARSQLVEIGGGFRVPDVMKQSGARLLEVGTTNRVHLSDYQRALEEQPVSAVMRVHRSNFQIVGFTTEPDLAEIAELAHKSGVSVIDDLGSGTLLDTAQFGLAHEPTIQESLQAGADLVCFSGDKLLGGPQAGIILGRADLLAKIKKHPLARAVRADKLCLAALSATLLHYLKDEALQQIPVWRMIAQPGDLIQVKASRWAAELGLGSLIPGHSTVGGGSLPGEVLPTSLLALDFRNPDRAAAQLRQANPPVIARVQENQLVLDPRTVFPEQEPALLAALHALVNVFSPRNSI